MPKNQSKLKFQSTSTTKDQQGNVTEEKSTKTILLEKEPEYIKLYVNTLLAFKYLPKQTNSLLFELLSYMTYADPKDEHGGQLIVLNMFVKDKIMKRLDIKLNTINHGLVKLVKAGMLKRVGFSTYQANPDMFGRGEWGDIKSIRATFDFNAGTVETVFETNSGKPRSINDIVPKSFSEHLKNTVEQQRKNYLKRDIDEDEEDEEEEDEEEEDNE